eukprot:COSAG01_NODE_1254_length_11042_cov_37.493192_5_plen_159_part_00
MKPLYHENMKNSVLAGISICVGSCKVLACADQTRPIELQIYPAPPAMWRWLGRSRTGVPKLYSSSKLAAPSHARWRAPMVGMRPMVIYAQLLHSLYTSLLRAMLMWTQRGWFTSHCLACCHLLELLSKVTHKETRAKFSSTCKKIRRGNGQANTSRHS